MSLLILGCNESKEKALVKLGLDRQMAHALTTQDTAYCREAGLPPALEATQILHDAVQTDSEASYSASRQQLQPYMKQLSLCLTKDYKFDGAWTEFEAWSKRTRAQAEALSRLKIERLELLENNTLRPEEKIERLKRIEAEYRAANSINGVVVALEDQGVQYDALKDGASALACLRKAFAEREAGGRHTMTMSLLIQIGFSLSKEGKVDSMLAYYNRALKIAEQSRDPGATTRALRLLGDYYEQQGQYAVGYELLRESTERGREYKAGNDEFGTLIHALGEYAAWGEWELMGDLLDRGDRLLAEANLKAVRSPQDRMFRDRMAMDFDTFRARRFMMTGHEAEGDGLFQALRDSSHHAPARQRFAQILYFWSSALVTGGHPQEAASLAREGLAYADSLNLPSEARLLNLTLADASCHLGDAAASEAALERFRSDVGDEEKAYRNSWMIHDRVRVCLALAAGDSAEAQRVALAGMARLERILASLDQSAQACLFLDDCRELREAIHEALGANAEAGYGFEMAWRGLYKTLGNGSHAKTFFGKGSTKLAERCAALGRNLQARVAAAQAIHSVYFAGSKQTILWTASRDGVSRESIRTAPSELEKSAKTVTQNLATGKSPNDPETASALTRLSTLLPAAITSKAITCILISPDSYLANLPFEAINLGTEEAYRPLIASHDIAYLRYMQQNSQTGSRHGLILANPQYPSVLTRRYPSLMPLPYGEKEAMFVAAAYPGSTYLIHGAATKQSFEDHWERADFIYVASHFIRSLETPYLSYLPLAGPEDAPFNGFLLEYSEIRQADLSGCGLVVLSGCGTGAVYTNVEATGPSLGDAFLDAGAHAVVHTRWRVEDEKAYDIARAFIRDWSRGEPLVVALNRAQRDAWRSARQPSASWTSYSISLSEIPSIQTRHARLMGD